MQTFATDLDEEAINIARAGLYPDSILANVSPERINNYFRIDDSGQYRVNKSIREMLVFAPQNIIKDPPFTKLDILSCRNVLIYLGSELQRKLFPTFHYSLKPDGLLFLGSSESIGTDVDLFLPLDKKWRIYRRQHSNSLARTSPSFSVTTNSLEHTEPAKPEGL